MNTFCGSATYVLLFISVSAWWKIASASVIFGGDHILVGSRWTERLSAKKLSMGSIHPNVEEDAMLPVGKLIEKYNYTVEVHQVITNDNYILQMHRITGGRRSPPRKGKTPVLLMHGILDSSSTWIVMGPDQGLAYLLADEGYDVWMGNARGNKYSRRHVSYDPDAWWWQRKKYWSFSWHEIGFFDLPAMIDHILATTEQPKLHYIGHSQGSSVFFVMCSLRPEYNDFIIMMNALAPIAYTKHIKAPIVRIFTPVMSILYRLASLIGAHEFMPSLDLYAVAGVAACRDKTITQSICANILFLIAGYRSQQLNATMLPVILGHTPSGSSAQQLVHYGQGVKSGHFRQFDHGYVQNFMKYKQLNPPDYNLTKVTAKVALYYSSNDMFAVVDDIRRLANELANVVSNNFIAEPSFNHLDVIWGSHAPRVIFQPMIDAMKTIESDIENRLV